MDTASKALLRHLQDRQEIEECVSRYAHAIDRHDEALIAAVYHPDAVDWHGPFSGGVAEFVPWVNALHERKTRAHTHNITTHWCEIRGERAFADTYVIFVLYRRDCEVVMMGSGRYIDRLERRGGEWKISERRTIIDMRLEAPAQELASSPGGYPKGTWDRSDATYRRPLTLPAELAAIAPAVTNSAAAPVPPALDASAAAALLVRCASRREIRDRVLQSVRGLDRGDRDLALQQYQAGAPVEDGAFRGTVEQHTDLLLTRFAQEDTILAHHLTSHLVEVSDNRAAAETYLTLMRHHKDGVTVWVGGLRLLDRLEKHIEGWKIVSRRVVADYEFEADGSAIQTDDQYFRSRRDRADLSHERS
jgi:3-phenylpropionate/cinnamic acid dioxygenase small subunit